MEGVLCRLATGNPKHTLQAAFYLHRTLVLVPCEMCTASWAWQYTAEGGFSPLFPPLERREVMLVYVLQVQTYAAWKESCADDLEADAGPSQNSRPGRGNAQRASALLPAKRPRQSHHLRPTAEPEIRPATPPPGDRPSAVASRRWCSIM